MRPWNEQNEAKNVAAATVEGTPENIIASAKKCWKQIEYVAVAKTIYVIIFNECERTHKNLCFLLKFPIKILAFGFWMI